ncbi:hypothetical protein BSKO_07339 [Bryopsis sp. KO-2023]|nr:hypothetical protein BSKO_07339 [Bryopsis sp. KO-2023]
MMLRSVMRSSAFGAPKLFDKTAVARSRAGRRVCCSKPVESARNGQPTRILNMEVALHMTAQLREYVLAHNHEPEVLADLRVDTHDRRGFIMQVSPEQGRFMSWLVETMNAKRAIEIGVFTGYSSIAVALALPEDGQLIAIDQDKRIMEVAQQFFETAGIAHKVSARIGRGQEEIAKVLEEEGPDSFDFAFIDADKRGYDAYYEACLKLLRVGGVIVLDNMLWMGKVADPEASDRVTTAIRDLNKKIFNDKRVSSTLVPIRDGVMLCRKL